MKIWVTLEQKFAASILAKSQITKTPVHKSYLKIKAKFEEIKTQQST